MAETGQVLPGEPQGRPLTTIGVQISTEVLLLLPFIDAHLRIFILLTLRVLITV